MVVILHGNKSTKYSTCTIRVITILKEKNIPFEFKEIGRADVSSEEYVDKMNPFRQIPVLEDDGYFLFESRAIGRYLASKFADSGTPNLVPSVGKSHKEIADFEKAMCVEATQFTAVELMAYEVIFKPHHEGGPPNEELMNRLKTQLQKKLDGYERILSKTKYMAGNHITLADLFHLPYAEILQNDVIPGALTVPERPNVARWWQEISSRESWQSIKKSLPA